MEIRALALLVVTVLLLPGALRGQLVRQNATTLTFEPELPSASSYMTEVAFPFTFTNPIATAFPPGETDRLYVVERGGRIRVINNLANNPTPTNVSTFLDLTAYLAQPSVNTPLSTDGENGLLGMAFHPNYQQNGYFYLYFSITVPGQPANTYHQRVARFQAIGTPGNFRAALNAGATAADVVTAPLLTIYDQASNHNGGALHFGADGYLYLSLGDEGGANDQFDNARFINRDFWGQLLRLDVDNRPENLVPNAHAQPNYGYSSAIHAGSYKVPADNPFIGYTRWHSQTIAASSVRTEIYATGLRNPFRWSFDPPTGRLFLADVGQNIWEEVNIVAKGDDLGWSWREGRHAFNHAPAPPAAPGVNDPPGTGFKPVEPIFEYDHTDDSSSPGGTPDGGPDAVIFGNSITGGAVYRGNRLTELFGAYIFCDYNFGYIVALREQSNGTWIGTRLAQDAQITHFGPDPRNGDLIFCDIGNGRVKRLARSTPVGNEPPATLAATGAFSDVATLTPAAGVVPYDVNVPFWSDGAIKSRWFAIKNAADRVTFSADGNWTFPTGMVWVKHFDLDVGTNPVVRRRVETRFLVKTATDIYGLSYRWDNFAGTTPQTTAALVSESGLSEPLAGTAQTWRFPSRAECRTCHTPIAGFALSFNTRQLNRTKEFGMQTQNQLTALSTAGYCTAPIANVNTLPAFAASDDATQSLEWRARSYLAVNCVQCHQPGGAAQGNWDARPTTPTDSASLINGLLVNNGGDPLARFAVPGDAPAFGAATHSMVLKRIRGDGAPRMPPLATNVRDLGAEALLSAWITQELPARQSFTQWQTAQFPGGGAAAAASADGDGDGQINTTEFLRRTNPSVANPPPLLNVTTTGGYVSLTFPHPANRSCLIESSVDLQNWAAWNVPGNAPLIPSTDQLRTIAAPLDVPRRFFRARITAP